MIFDVRVVDGRLMSEDNVMCDKLRAAGIDVWLDPRITCPHIGAKRYTGNFAAWLAKLQSEQATTRALAGDGRYLAAQELVAQTVTQ